MRTVPQRQAIWAAQLTDSCWVTLQTRCSALWTHRLPAFLTEPNVLEQLAISLPPPMSPKLLRGRRWSHHPVALPPKEEV